MSGLQVYFKERLPPHASTKWLSALSSEITIFFVNKSGGSNPHVQVPIAGVQSRLENFRHYMRGSALYLERVPSAAQPALRSWLHQGTLPVRPGDEARITAEEFCMLAQLYTWGREMKEIKLTEEVGAFLKLELGPWVSDKDFVATIKELPRRCSLVAQLKRQREDPSEFPVAHMRK